MKWMEHKLSLSLKWKALAFFLKILCYPGHVVHMKPYEIINHLGQLGNETMKHWLT